jgi:hypothetical protein
MSSATYSEQNTSSSFWEATRLSLASQILTGLPSSTVILFQDLRTSLDSVPSPGARKKQPIITLSSMEAEYVVLTHAAKDALWIHKILKEFSFLHDFLLPTTLYCDNQGTIRLSKDTMFHGRTKHINIHFHFIQQTITSGSIELVYIPTKNMTADIFTKSLPRVKFEKFRDNLNVM